MQMLPILVQPDLMPPMTPASEQVLRKITYRLYPSKTQAKTLLILLGLHRQLYNAALEQRISAWRRQRVSLSYAGQCEQLTLLRRECPEFAVANCSSQQMTLRRLDKAFKAFFRRATAGETAGFPRFKGRDRFNSIGFKGHGDGWRFTFGADGQHGKLRLQGVGIVKARGQARTMGEIKASEVLHDAGIWSLSLTVACTPVRQHGTKAKAYDWGVASFATIVDADGNVEKVANPRGLQKVRAELRVAQRAVSRKKKGGENRTKAKAKVARIHRDLTNRRNDFLHQESACLVGDCALIATEGLRVKNMTASAKGTVEAPGRNAKQKAGLNREILDTAPARYNSLVRSKAEEAGIELVIAPTRSLKPSQRCPRCDRVEKKTLAMRVHSCPQCGLVMDRDAASALVVVIWALKRRLSLESGTGSREISASNGLRARETPPKI